MSWVKLDDGFADHPKVLAAGALAAFLWACGLAYCNRQKQRTGVIPATKVPVLYPLPNPMKLATRLVDVGLWERVDGGFRVHDYHEYQPSDDLKAARAEAGRRGGTRSGEVRRAKQPTKQLASGNEANAKQLASGNEAFDLNPVPDPEPDPTERVVGFLPTNASAEAAESITARAREATHEPIEPEVLEAAHRRFPHLIGREQLVAYAWATAKQGGPPRELHRLDELNGHSLAKILAHLGHYFATIEKRFHSFAQFVETFGDHDPDAPPSQVGTTRGARGQPLTGSMAAVRRVGERILAAKGAT